MSAAVYDELLRFVVTRTEDPEINARKRRMVRVLVDTTPEVREELVDQGRLSEARSALRRVLAQRKLTPSAEEQTSIDACTERGTLERWLDQAVTAPSVAEALQ